MQILNVVKRRIPALAIEFTGKNVESELTILAIAGSVEEVEKHFFWKDDELFIRTLEGDMHVSIGSYIIKGNDGEFWAVARNIFVKTYEVLA